MSQSAVEENQSPPSGLGPCPKCKPSCLCFKTLEQSETGLYRLPFYSPFMWNVGLSSDLLLHWRLWVVVGGDVFFPRCVWRKSSFIRSSFVVLLMNNVSDVKSGHQICAAGFFLCEETERKVALAKGFLCWRQVGIFHIFPPQRTRTHGTGTENLMVWNPLGAHYPLVCVKCFCSYKRKSLLKFVNVLEC